MFSRVYWLNSSQKNALVVEYKGQVSFEDVPTAMIAVYDALDESRADNVALISDMRQSHSLDPERVSLRDIYSLSQDVMLDERIRWMLVVEEKPKNRLLFLGKIVAQLFNKDLRAFHNFDYCIAYLRDQPGFSYLASPSSLDV